MTVNRPCENDKPERVYLLWAGGYYLSADKTGALLAFTSKADAESRAKYELDEHKVESIPVRVK